MAPFLVVDKKGQLALREAKAAERSAFALHFVNGNMGTFWHSGLMRGFDNNDGGSTVQKDLYESNYVL